MVHQNHILKEKPINHNQAHHQRLQGCLFLQDSNIQFVLMNKSERTHEKA